MVFRLENYISYHVVNKVWVILFTSMIVGYAYATDSSLLGTVAALMNVPSSTSDHLDTWLLGHSPMTARIFPAAFLMVFCNVIAPIPLWRKKVRNNLVAVWIICGLINVGMWFERFNIVGSSLQRGLILTTGRSTGQPWWKSVSQLVASASSSRYNLFVKALPPMAIMELKEAAEPPTRKGHRRH